MLRFWCCDLGAEVWELILGAEMGMRSGCNEAGSIAEKQGRQPLSIWFALTGRRCKRGDITGATLRDDLFLVRYDCGQLESCLGPRVLRANLDPLLQHPLPAECQRVVKAKLGLVREGGEAGQGGQGAGVRATPGAGWAGRQGTGHVLTGHLQIYPGGLPEEKLPRVTSLVYLYSCAEISQWNITSMDTLVALLASDVALDNQTEVWDHDPGISQLSVPSNPLPLPSDLNAPPLLLAPPLHDVPTTPRF